MNMSETLRQYLELHGAPFELVSHPDASSSTEAAASAHVPGDLLAKAVLIEDEDHYVAVVVPATRHVDLAAVQRRLGRRCGLAAPREIGRVFTDCENDALPAVAQAFGLDVLVDDALGDLDEVWFSSGSSDAFVRMPGSAFAHIMRDADSGRFAERWD